MTENISSSLSHRPEAIEKILPEPLTFDEPLVKYEFIRMPNSTGFGDLHPSPARSSRCGSTGNPLLHPCDVPQRRARQFTAAANYGFSKKLGQPSLSVHQDALVGTLDYGPVRIAPA